MIFGSPSEFAIEAEIVEVRGRWTYGKLRFWIGGVAIGDFGDTSDLASSARWGRTFVAASPQRTHSESDGARPDDVYERLYGRFVEPVDGPSTGDARATWERDACILDDVGDAALRDKFATIVTRRADGADRILVKSFASEALEETVVPSEVVDAVVIAYCEWVENNGNH